MKQTPIPEKIEYTLGPTGWIAKICQTVDSMLDVLTEQQKEIEDLKKCKCICHLSGNAQCAYCQCITYTAMRSTGDSFSKAKDIKPLQREDVYGYCKCPEPLPCHCHEPSMCSYCSKPIKL